MSKWEKLRDPLLQFAILAVSTFIAALLTPTLMQNAPKFLKIIWISDERTALTTIVSFLTPICYLLFWASSGALNVLTDKRRIFTGTYLGFPRDLNIVNVFKIYFMNGKLVLVGYRFSLTNAISSSGIVTGSWRSDEIEMTTVEPLKLVYNYLGWQHEPMTLSGRGFVSISFNGKRPERGQGSWVSIVDFPRPFETGYSNYVKLTNSTSAELTDSNYVKVTPDVIKKIVKKAFYLSRIYPYLHIRRFVREPLSIFNAFAAIPENERNQYPFQRPRNHS